MTETAPDTVIVVEQPDPRLTFNVPDLSPGDIRFQLESAPIPRSGEEPFVQVTAARFLFVDELGTVVLELTHERAVVYGHVIEPKTPDEAREVFDGFKAFIHACFNPR